MATANGRFHGWRITRVDLDFARPERSEVEVEVDVASLDTGSARRDDHLRSDDFFDVAKWPTATVKIHQASRSGESERGHPRYAARFSVRIRVVEQTVTGEFEVTSESPLTVEGHLVLNRVDFGVGDPHRRWNPLSIRDEIPVEFTARIPGGS